MTGAEETVTNDGNHGRPESGRIVVGVDGSQGSLHALRWALREARLRHAPVLAVLAWQFHPTWSDPGPARMFPTNFGTGIGDQSGMPVPLESDVPGQAPSAAAPSRRESAESGLTNALDSVIA